MEPKLRQRLKAAAQAFSAKSYRAGDGSEWVKLAEWLGIDADKDNDAQSEATYFACIKVLSESVGKMTCRLLQQNADGGVKAMRHEALYGIIADRPNPYMSAVTFWATMERSRNHHGNAVALIEGAGHKMKLWPIPWEEVEVWYDDAKRIDNVPDVYYIWSTPEGNFTFKSEEVLHLKTSMSADGITGLSVQEILASTVQSNIKSQDVVNKLYDNGFTAKAVLQYTGSLSDKNAQKFVKGIEDYATGKMKDKGVSNIVPIPIGATLTPLNMKLTEAQYVEIRKYTALQIASAFGIKPYHIGDYGKESYASQSAQQLSFYVDTLLFILKGYEQELNYKLLTAQQRNKGYHFKFNVASILRADLKTQIETLSLGVSSFLYMPNEARELLDLPAVPGGDRLLGNGASIPVDMAGVQYANATTAEGGENNG